MSALLTLAVTRIAVLIFLWMGNGSVQTLGNRVVHPVTGRVIAGTMSVDGADWLDRPEREREEQPEKAIAALHLAPGMNVGEIGAGTGRYVLCERSSDRDAYAP